MDDDKPRAVSARDPVDSSYFDQKWWSPPTTPTSPGTSSIKPLLGKDSTSSTSGTEMEPVTPPVFPEINNNQEKGEEEDGDEALDELKPLVTNGTNRGILRKSYQDNAHAHSGLRRTSSDLGRDPAEKVRFIISDDQNNDEAWTSSPDSKIDFSQRSLFCQMDVLCHFASGAMGWKESARWIKFEEKVDGGDRWSKPHVATTSLHALFEIRKSIADGSAVVLLDLEGWHGCVHQVAGQSPTKDKNDHREIIMSAIVSECNMSEETASKVRDVLLTPHKHQHRATKNKHEGVLIKRSSQIINTDMDEKHTYPVGTTADDLEEYKPNKHLQKKLPAGTEAANILVGQVDFLKAPINVFCRMKKATVLADLTEVAVPSRFMFLSLGPRDPNTVYEYDEMGRAMAALFSDKVFTEVAYKAHTRQDIVDGIDEFIDDLTVLPPSIWDPATRLEPPEHTLTADKLQQRLTDSGRRASLGDGTLKLDGHGDDGALDRTGRLFGGLIKDAKRKYSIYWSDLRDGLHPQCFATIVFLYFACITPIVTFGGLMGSATDGYMGTIETLLSGAICGTIYHFTAGQPLTIVGATGPLLVFESLLYVFCKDQGWDFLAMRIWIGSWVSLILFIMVAFDLSSLVKYITRFTEESFAVLISLIFVFEAFAKTAGVYKYNPIHTATLHMDPAYGCHCVETNATTVTPTLAADTLHNIITARTEAPLPMNVTDTSSSYVYGYVEPNPLFNTSAWSDPGFENCITHMNRLIVSSKCVSEKECTKEGWDLVGDACFDAAVTHSVSDVFLLSVFLFLGTFGVAYTLRIFRNAPYFPSIVRSTVADFAVITSIVIFTSIDFSCGIATPKLMVPEKLETTRSDRSWVCSPFGIFPDYWWLAIASVVPAALATILIFLDQQITGVIVNRQEHKLKKGAGYHLDLFVLAFLILICSFLGLPWFVAATVRSITHVKSLMKQSGTAAPGEKPTFLGVREQRLTGIVIHLLIGLSVLMTPVLKLIPMPVLYGVFMYMGITSLGDVQFVDRILILFMPAKYQPDYVYLRHVATKRVHIFTVVQALLMIGMWAVKSIKSISLAFPIMVLALCFVRKAMDWIFTQNELFWLDHILPEESRRKKDDEMRRGKHRVETTDTEEEQPTEWKQVKADSGV